MNDGRALQLVLFDLPLAPLYGGTAEVDLKIRTLLDLGMELHIHAWVSPVLDRQLRQGLVPLPDWHARVASLQWYPRPHTLAAWFSFRPHAVATRQGVRIDEALSQGPKDVLLEGWQCSACLVSPNLQSHRLWVRAHNRESSYYALQAQATNNLFKKIYYNIESIRWRRWEKRSAVAAADGRSTLQGVLSLCPMEAERYQSEGHRTLYLPAFVRLDRPLPEEQHRLLPNLLYHGRLDIPDNQNAAFHFLAWAKANPQYAWVLAGSRASKALLKGMKETPNLRWVDTPDEPTLRALILTSAVHVLPSVGRAGIRLKMIHALAGTGHVLVDRSAVEGLPWESWVTPVARSVDWLPAIRNALENPLKPRALALRHQAIHQHFDPAQNAGLLVDWILGSQGS